MASWASVAGKKMEELGVVGNLWEKKQPMPAPLADIVASYVLLS
jgi:hypothetical protein